MATIKAVCISEKKGTAKKNIGQAELIENFGLRDDAHAGDWHRQVSLLSYEKIEEFKALGVDVKDGDFGENLIVEGIDVAKIDIYSISGIMTASQLNSNTINLANHKGVYIAVVTDQNGNRTTHKVVL